jgi:hypothetical protein
VIISCTLSYFQLNITELASRATPNNLYSVLGQSPHVLYARSLELTILCSPCCTRQALCKHNQGKVQHRQIRLRGDPGRLTRCPHWHMSPRN